MCDDLSDHLDQVRSVAAYDGWLREAIIRFKYHDERARANYLGDLLVAAVTDLAPFDALVPVPLHPRRARERGFNQAQMLAERAARVDGHQIANHLLRVRPTARQVGLDAATRRLNVAGAFAVPLGADVAGMRLVLVDDVLTTGSTLEHCAAALRSAGAASVSAATLARGA